MKILVIDGMGGGIGKAAVEHILLWAKESQNPRHIEIIAAGSNSAATSAMLKSGANYGATGENAIVYNSLQANIIIGPIGIIFANSMHGEISPAMANAVTSSPAHKILIPVSKCGATVLGCGEKPLGEYLAELRTVLEKTLNDTPSLG